MEELQSTFKSLNLYDIKAAVRKAQNIVMNYTSMEAKVREATNNEPWGASSSLMQTIAQGTFNYTQLNEIMGMIYRRFTEKTAEEWRQIYKALQLLEYLIKHGSERVIDDARAHIATIKMLRNFHYIDHKQQDQGLNVRNRAKEVIELLNDNDRLRKERKKARLNKDKFIGVSNHGETFVPSIHGRHSSRTRMMGFGSSSFGSSGTSRIYGDGGGFSESGSTYHDTVDDARSEYSEDETPAPSRAKSRQHSRHTSIARRYASAPNKRSTETSSSTKSTPAQAPQSAMIDLVSLDDTPTVNSFAPFKSATTTTNTADAFDDDGFGEFQSSTVAAADEDEFDDFQSAPIANTQPASSFSTTMPAFSQPSSTAQTPAMNLLSATFTSPSANTMTTTTFNSKPATTTKTSSSVDAFSNLWSSAKKSNPINNNAKTPSTPVINTSTQSNAPPSNSHMTDLLL
ncbi:ENTH/VHS domain-containing protein Ent3 [Schizosaccharomyces japonicus yFS275]|uniref:ENTH/VHS domain-containing protein Ent3 n=1 Tax=Schizosaccharomyces japonicus (strain yFS275 / FY16936) TaxID=402676 RepID=B6K1R5_SCHJY|nr:ENTH/VHS domain-containing protein Ent3 [Schizosaccharomyces japonicus yFS275]EEB07096.1 ENTH/VHS domain-containing protein Ent3 [Schizosaccharomyces japonicus yFS275]